jgi:hypothetical protein
LGKGNSEGQEASKVCEEKKEGFKWISPCGSSEDKLMKAMDYKFPKNYLSRKKKRKMPIKFATDSKKSVSQLVKGGGSSHVVPVAIK